MSEGESRRGGSLAGRLILLWIIGPLLVVGALVVGVVRNPPTEALLDLVAREFNRQTGYAITFGQGSSVKLWPDGVVALERVEIRRPALHPTIGGVVADAGRITARFDLIALAFGPRAIEAIEVEAATVTAHEADVRLLRANLAAARAAGGAAGITFKTITLTDTLIAYQVAPPNPVFTLTGVEARVTNAGPEGIAKFDGRFELTEEPVTFAGAAPRAAGGGGVDLALSFQSEKATAVFEGVAGGGRPGGAKADLFTGEALIRLTAAGPALRWLGIGPGKDYPALAGPMTLTGPVRLSEGFVELHDVLMKSAFADGKGEVTANFSGARAKLTGRVDWQRLDLEGIAQPVRGPQSLAVVSRPAAAGLVIPSLWDELQAYLGSLEATGEPPRAAIVATGMSAGGVSGERAAGRLTRQVGAAPLRAQQRQAVDLSALEAVDLDLVHTAKELRYNGIVFDGVELRSRLEGGQLALGLDRATFAGGRWTGQFDLDARADRPSFALKLDGRGVDAGRLQQAATRQSALTGRGDVTATLEGSGTTPDAIVESLAGTVRVDVGEGNLVGYDLKAILTQFWRTWSYDARRRTPFDKVGARVRLDRGVIETVGYASLRGGEAELDSRGTVSLVAKSLDQRVRARLTWPPNQLPLPARISGPWSSPKVAVDWGIFSARPGFFDLPPGLRGEPGAETRSLAPAAAAGRSVPADLAKDIGRVLADEAVAAKMPDKLRRTLESLAARGTRGRGGE